MKTSMKLLAGMICVAGFSLTQVSYATSPTSMSSTTQTSTVNKTPAGNLVKMQVRYKVNGKMHTTNVLVPKDKVVELKKAKNVELLCPLCTTYMYY